MAQSLRKRREAVIRRHVEAESRGDVDGVVASFSHPKYEMVPLGTEHDGEAAVRLLLSSLFLAFPDFKLVVRNLYHSDKAVIAEVWMDGTHRAPWAGVEAKGHRIHLPVVGIFLFEGDKLLCEKVYFDSATLLRQITIGK